MRRSDVFVDSGAWIALSIEPDTHHERASRLFRQLTSEPRLMVTTNLIVAEAYEAIRRIGGTGVALRFLELTGGSPRLLKIYSDNRLEERAEAVLRQHDDQRFSFVDAVSFAVMHDRSIREAFAFDRHFETAGFFLL